MGKYELVFKSSAEKELFKLPDKDCQKITRKIRNLTDVPLPIGYQKLAGSNDHYRIRQGNYRILYSVDKGAKKIFIFKIGHRKEIYRT